MECDGGHAATCNQISHVNVLSRVSPISRSSHSFIPLQITYFNTSVNGFQKNNWLIHLLIIDLSQNDTITTKIKQPHTKNLAIANRSHVEGIYRVAQIKIPTGQNAISRQPCEIFIPKFLDLYWRDPATIRKFKKKIFQFSPKLWLYKYSMPYFKFCTE